MGMKRLNTVIGDEAWAEALRQGFLMAGEGLPVRRIVAELESAGARGPKGRRLTVATLWRHLRDESYAEGGAALVSPRLFRRTVDGLESRRRR